MPFREGIDMNTPEPAELSAGVPLRPTILLFAFLVAISFLTSPTQSAFAAAVGEFNAVIPLDTRVKAAEGSRTVLATQSVPEEFAGQTCTVTARAENQASVHPGNDLVVESETSVTLPDVERGSGSVVTAEEQIVLGSEIVVSLIMGPDESFSAGLDVHVACTGDVAPTTVASTTTTLASTTTLAVTSTDDVRGTVVTSTPEGDEVEDPETLPFTGSHDGYWVLLAGAALLLGMILVVGARRDEG
jgi:LPXTG-motif cell wall-anchored protein